MKQKLNAKDFILIGILTALMWIICMIISTIMSVAGPVTNVFYPSVVAIPNGIVMMSVFGVTVLKLIPIVMMGLWILRTTYMDDLMVALQRMRLPQAVTIPLVVMFRYIPTLRIEYRQIRSTMDIRGISDTVWKRVCHPLATIEYILIPLLMRCLKVTDELAASGTTRGLELECKRYALRPIRFAWPEIVVSLLGILFLVGLLFIDQTQIGKIILWRV